MHREPSFFSRHALRFTDSQGGSLAYNEKSLRKKVAAGERKIRPCEQRFLGALYLLSERRVL